MKLVVVFLAALALAVASQVKLRDGIVPRKLPAIELGQVVWPDDSWQQIKDVLLEEGEITDGYIEADVTKYVTTLLKNVEKLIVEQGFDPMTLADEEIKLFPTGTVDLSKGFLQDLSTITLSSTVIAKYSISTKILELTLPLEFKSLLITYDYHTQIILISIRGAVDAKISNFKLNLHMGFNFSNYHAFVDKADIRDSGSISLKLTGLGLLDWIIDLMDGVLITLFHGIILSIVNIIIQIPVESVVNSINQIIDDILQRNGTAFMDY